MTHLHESVYVCVYIVFSGDSEAEPWLVKGRNHSCNASLSQFALPPCIIPSQMLITDCAEGVVTSQEARALFVFYSSGLDLTTSVWYIEVTHFSMTA